MDHLTPLTAPVADNPYPYYEDLVRSRPLYYDDAIAMWVASSARAVEAVLDNDDLCVRPTSTPVPKAMAGTALGDVFANLVRMNDAPNHDALKDSIVRAIRRSSDRFAIAAESCAKRLSADVDPFDAATFTTYTFALMPFTLATLLGLDETAIEPARRFARAMAPDAGEPDIARGAESVAFLVTALRQALAGARRTQFVDDIVDEARRNKIDEEIAIANAAGFFFQSYDATAGLMGNTLAALAAAPLAGSVRHDRELLDRTIAEVACNDSPVHNTRRFAARGTRVLDGRIQSGQTVLAILAAANRDPNKDPDKVYTFGTGPHACAGARAATTVASAGITALLERGVDPAAMSVCGYEPATNVRVPKFAAKIAAPRS